MTATCLTPDTCSGVCDSVLRGAQNFGCDHLPPAPVRTPACNRSGCTRGDRHTHTGDLAPGDRIVIEPVDGRSPTWAFNKPCGTFVCTDRTTFPRYIVDVDGHGRLTPSVGMVRLTRVGTYQERQRSQRNKELAAHGRKPGSGKRKQAINAELGVEVAMFDFGGEPVVDLLADVVGVRLDLWRAIGAQQAEYRARGTVGRGAHAISAAAVASRLTGVTVRKVVSMLKAECDLGTVARAEANEVGRATWKTTDTGRAILAAIGL